MSVFLSYARSDDEPFVRRLFGDLTSAGVETWWDRVSMPSRGLTFLQEIREAIDGRERLVLVVGPAAVTSDYVRSEWQYALVADKVVVPVLRLGDFDQLPSELKNVDCVDFRESRDYGAALAKLLTDLRAPLPRLGRLLGVPSPPPHFRPRGGELSEVSRLVLLDLQNPVVLSPTARTTVVHGMGGVGKSVLAAAFARSTETRRAFADGVFWFDARSRTPLASMLASIARQYGDDRDRYASDEIARHAVARAIVQKACLIVLDNVSTVAEAEPFVDAIAEAPRAHILITTREGSLVSSLACQEVALRELAEDAALESLADWSREAVDSLPAEAQEVARECGGLPFALALCGAMVHDGNTWADLLGELRRANLSFLEGRQLNYPFPDLLRCFKVSMDLLGRASPQGLRLYREMVVFAEGAAVPESAVLRLWLRDETCSPPAARKLLVTLERKALLRLEGRAPNRLVTLHDLQRDYLQATTSHEAITRLHAALLQAYATACPSDWPTGPRDGYFHQQLVYHLERAGRPEEIDRLLALDDPGGLNAWYEARRSQQDVAGYRADLMRARELSMTPLGEGESPGERVGRQVRYALCIASINSWFPNLPCELVGAAAEKGVWTAEQALRYARENPRVDTLTTLARVLPGEAWETLWEVASDLPEGLSRTEALVSLAPFAPGGRRIDAFHTALATTREVVSSEEGSSLEWEVLRAGSLERLVGDVPEELFEEALATVASFRFEYERFELTSKLTPRLPESLLVSARAQRLVSGVNPAATERGAPPSPDLQPADAEEALARAHAIPGAAARAGARAKLSLVLPDHLKDEALRDAVRSAMTIETGWIQAKSLLDIEPFCHGEHLSAVAEAARALDAGDSRVCDYVSRMTCMGKAEGARLAQQLLRRAHDLTDPLASFRELRKLAARVPPDLKTLAIRGGLGALGRMSGLQALAVLREGPLEPPWNEALPRFAELVPTLEGEARAELAVAVRSVVSENRWGQFVHTILEDRDLIPASVERLLPHLEGPLLRKALERGLAVSRRAFAAMSREEFSRWLATLAPLLPKERLAEALLLAQSIGDQVQIARLGLGLASHLPGDRITNALDLIPEAELDGGLMLEHRNYLPESLVAALPECLVPKALDRIRALDWEPVRLECLVLLARHAPADHKPALSAALLEAWLGAYHWGVREDAGGHCWPGRDRLRLLKSITPLMTEADLEALVAATPRDGESAALVLSIVGPTLPPERRGRVFADALQVIEAEQDSDARMRHLVDLALHFPEPEQTRAIDLAFDAIEASLPKEEGYDFTVKSVFEDLGPYLPAALADRALGWLARLHAGEDVRLLAKLFVSLSPAGRVRCLAQVRSFEDFKRGTALVELLRLMPESERAGAAQESLDAFLAVLRQADRSRELLADRLSQEDALRDALESSEAEEAFEGLSKAAPHLDENSRRNILSASRSASGGLAKLVPIAALAPALPDVDAGDLEVLTRAWRTAQRRWLFQSLAALISRTPEPHQFEAWLGMGQLGIGDIAMLAPQMSQRSREAYVDAAVRYLEAHLSEIRDDGDQRTATTKELARLAAACTDAQLGSVLLLALALEPERSGRRITESIAAETTKLAAETLYRVWCTALDALVTRDRPFLLEALLPLCPILLTLGGRETASAVFRSLEDVRRWWP